MPTKRPPNASGTRYKSARVSFLRQKTRQTNVFLAPSWELPRKKREVARFRARFSLEKNARFGRVLGRFRTCLKEATGKK